MAYIQETGDILGWLGYAVFDDFSYNADGALDWYNTDPEDPYYPDGPSEQDILAQAKAWAGSKQTKAVYQEQSLRSQSVFIGQGLDPINMPPSAFALMEELYLSILLPSARKAITEADTPLWWGLKQIRDNRNTLLTNLQLWIDDPAKSYLDILGFDVAGWNGWSFPRP